MAKKIANLIGLAGQSCAGKNIVADLLAEKGYAVIDADKVAHAVLQEQGEAIIERFAAHAEKRGLRLRGQDGLLDRKALSVLLFLEPALLAEHEAFILPKIEERIRILIADALLEQPNRPIILNAPTLHKTSLTPECSFILYIKAPFFIRLIRGKRRDNISLCRLIARFLQQRDFFTQYLLQNADIVSVVNAGSVQALRKKIEHILREKGF
ncbi:dephospho-CoA kinase [Treponema vincentii ATCC 35580]|uniref:Dephospho-CoA kinase n=1 Tax=Treponema vincentii ATCC 35580 TaxID=596324 RepID=C8PM66_9SPIR|nr:dephospho-CoA kinase [Treponema vincentii]EEV21283.1 dephospho-CoA kinase [Treponema vincentii ATCC 35580]